jgi:hypothetical protein
MSGTGPVALWPSKTLQWIGALKSWLTGTLLPLRLGLASTASYAERQAVQADVGVPDGDGPADGHPHLQLDEGGEEAVVKVRVAVHPLAG